MSIEQDIRKLMQHSSVLRWVNLTEHNTIQCQSKTPEVIQENTQKTPEELVNSFRDSWNSQGVQNFVFAKNGKIELSKLVVPHAARNSGVGSMYMKQLTDIADATHHMILVTPSSDFGGSKHRLVDFYSKHGFVQNSGKHKDFSFMHTMYRPPATQELHEMMHVQEEGWLHVQNRKPMRPIEHVRNIVAEHEKLGWQMVDDAAIVLHHDLKGIEGGGCARSVQMKKGDVRVVLHVKFRGKQNSPHVDYKINREFRTYS